MRKDRFDQDRLINIANGLTSLRILLLPLFAYLLISGQSVEAIAIFAICGVSDALDGVIARRLHQRTLIGAYLDPIADKLLMATSFIVLSIVHVIPAWLTILVISRDIFILIGCFLYLLLLDDAEIAPTFLSKLNTVVQILTVIYFLTLSAFPALMGVPAAGTRSILTLAVVVLCAVTTAISGVQYVLLGMKTLSDA